MNELPATRSAQWPVAGGKLRLHRGELQYVKTPPTPPAGVPRESTLSVRRGGCYRLPGWSGQLQVTRVRDNGVPLAWLARIDLKPREGAETFQAGAGRPPRNLKKQFQSAGVPAWARNGPLIYSGGQLVFVPGLGLDARVIGMAGQALMSLHWLPAGAGP
jgi:tRNA(Ile)-lysidine synthase